MTESQSRASALFLTIFLFLLCPTIVLSLQSYIATVNITVKPIYYLHKTDVSGVTPAGKLMNITKPPSNQTETTYQIDCGSSVYFYTPTLSAGSMESGTWTLYIWASTANSGNTSKLTVEICRVSLNGSTVKATIGTTTNATIDYGYSERTFIVSGNAATIASGDRIRLKLLAQTGSGLDADGIIFYYDGYGSYQTTGHETRLRPP
jgi:hypothetical protein